MAQMKPCKVCGKAVATSATTCPHCGAKNPTFTARQFGIGCLSVIVVGAVLGGLLSTCGGDAPGAQDKPGAAKGTPAAEATVPGGTLGYTPAEFSARMNGFLAQGQFDARLPDVPQLEPGDQGDSFKTLITDRLGVIVRVDRSTGKVDSVVLLADGDGTKEGALDVMAGAAAVYAAALPGDHPLKTGASYVVDLMSAYKSDDKVPASVTVQGVKLWHMRSDGVGLLYGAEPA